MSPIIKAAALTTTILFALGGVALAQNAAGTGAGGASGGSGLAGSTPGSAALTPSESPKPPVTSGAGRGGAGLAGGTGQADGPASTDNSTAGVPQLSK